MDEPEPLVALCVRLASLDKVTVGARYDPSQQRGHADLKVQDRCEALLEMACSNTGRLAYNEL